MFGADPAAWQAEATKQRELYAQHAEAIITPEFISGEELTEENAAKVGEVSSAPCAPQKACVCACASVA